MQKLVKKTYTNPPLAMKVYIMKQQQQNMIQFAMSKGFNVRSTTFPHKDIHKETWHSADSRTANQIDHVLISNRFGSTITDIRALRGPGIGSDHNLLKINFKVKIRVQTEKKYSEKRKIMSIFQNSK